MCAVRSYSRLHLVSAFGRGRKNLPQRSVRPRPGAVEFEAVAFAGNGSGYQVCQQIEFSREHPKPIRNRSGLEGRVPLRVSAAKVAAKLSPMSPQPSSSGNSRPIASPFPSRYPKR